MRIAYCINSVEGGGAALPVPSVVALLRACGAEVRVLALTPRDRRALPAFRAAAIETEVREGGTGDHLGALRWLDTRVAAYAPDLIWTSLSRATLLGQWVGWRRGIPVASWQHAAYLKPANLRLLRAMRRRTALWIGDSETVTALTAARLGVPAERLACWPLFAADPARAVAAPWEPGMPVRIGSLGRLHPVKGYATLIEALRRLAALPDADALPAWQLAIAGEGAERVSLEAQIRAAGLSDRVALPGFVDAPDCFLAGLHLYCQPSRSEGLCVALHEAMTAGLPAIVSAAGEMPRSVRPGVTGAVVAPGDPAALAEALRVMLVDPARLAVQGARARADMLARFGPDAFAGAGRAIYRRLELIVAERRRAPGGASNRSASRVRSDRPV